MRFVAQRAIGESLCRKRDAAGLQRLDTAIALLDNVRERCSPGSGYILNGIYRLRIEACRTLGQPDEAKNTALAGTRRFVKAGQFDESIAWLYHYCLTEALDAGQEKESLAVCDAYRAGVERRYWIGREFWTEVSVKREELLARLAGKTIPGMDDLLPARGMTRMNLKSMRMAATDLTLWIVASEHNAFGFGKAFQYWCDLDETQQLEVDKHRGFCGVAATKDAIFLCGYAGLYKLDSDGNLQKHYDPTTTAMPGRGYSTFAKEKAKSISPSKALQPRASPCSIRRRTRFPFSPPPTAM